MNETYEIDASEVRKLRKRLDETQSAFAERFGVNQSTVQRWETKGPGGVLARAALARLISETESRAA